MIVGIFQIDNWVAVAVRHLLDVVDRESVRGAKIYPKVVIVIILPICVRSKKGSSIYRINWTLCSLSCQIRLECVLFLFPKYFVLFELLLLIGSSLELTVILLFKSLDAETVLESLLALSLAPNDVLVIRDTHSFHLHSSLLLCLLLYSLDLCLLTLEL